MRKKYLLRHPAKKVATLIGRRKRKKLIKQLSVHSCPFININTTKNAASERQGSRARHIAFPLYLDFLLLLIDPS